MLNEEGKQGLPHQYLYLLCESWLDSVPGLSAAPELSSDSDSDSSVEKALAIDLNLTFRTRGSEKRRQWGEGDKQQKR